jgi:hypothetical protein
LLAAKGQPAGSETPARLPNRLIYTALDFLAVTAARVPPARQTRLATAEKSSRCRPPVPLARLLAVGRESRKSIAIEISVPVPTE